MYHSHAVSLLEIVRELRGIELTISWVRCEDGERLWLLEGEGTDQQLWRVLHADLLEGALILSDMLIGCSPDPRAESQRR